MPASPLPLFLALASPGGPGERAPDRDWDLQHLHLELDISPDEGRVSGSVTLTLAPLLPASPELVLDQIGLSVSGVTREGAPLPFRVDGDHLHVTVGEASGPVAVKVDYAATPRSGLHFRGPGPASPDTYLEAWTQGEDEDNRRWIPLPDHPNDRFTSSGRFTAPEGFRVLSNGVGRFDGEAWTYEMEEDLVSYLVMLAAAPYQTRSYAWRDVSVEQWLPPDVEADQAAAVSALLPEMLEYFSARTGLDYPYAAYREVYVQRFIFTGMENTTSTVMHRRLLGEPGAPSPGDGHERVMAHELAHQWYGDALTCRAWSELWLNEGFAQFFSDDWLRHKHGDAAHAARLMKSFDHSLSSGPLAGRFWSTPAGDHAPSSAVYVKGASVLRMLQVMLGEEAFWAAIARYTQDNAHGLVETHDLRRAFEAITGDNLAWFFDQWAHLPGAPALRAATAWEDGQLTLTLTQTPPEGAEPFTFLVELEIGAEDGPRLERVWVRGAETRLIIPLEEAPSYVAVDPRGGLLAKLDNTQSPQMWRAQLGSPHPYAQLRALERAAKAKAPEAWLPAVLPLLDHEDPAIAVAAMAALGGLDQAEGNAALIGVMENQEARIELRVAAATALGAGAGAGDAAGALEALIRGLRRSNDLHDRSLAGAALGSLKALAPARAADAARAALSQRAAPSPVVGPRLAAALGVLANEGAPADLPLLLRWASPTLSTDVVHAALSAASKVAREAEVGPRREAAMAQVARRAERLLADASIRTRAQAIHTLGEVGDREALRALERYRKQETVADLSAQAANAEALIRARLRAGEAPEAPSDSTLEELERRLEELSEAIEELQRRL